MADVAGRRKGASFGQQLRVLLWKNTKLRRRSPVSMIVEIFIPLFLFVIMAWIRSDQMPEDIDTQRYNTIGLPSSGVLPLAQSLLCGGIKDFDSEQTNTLLDQAAKILEDRDVSPARVLEILQNTTYDEQALNRTLYDLGLGQIAQAIIVPLPDIDLNTDVTNYTQLGDAVDAVCSWVRNDGLSLLDQVGANNFNSSVFDNITIGSVDLTSVLRSDDPLVEFLIELAENQTGIDINTNFDVDINSTVPSLFDALNAAFPDAFNLSDSQVDSIVRSLNRLAQGADEDTIRQELEQQLNDFTGLNEDFIELIVGIEAVSNIPAAFDVLFEVINATGALDADTAKELKAELDRLGRDLTELEGIEEAIDEILSLDGVERIRQELEESDVDVFDILSEIVCEEDPGTSFGGSIRFQRSVADDSGTQTQHSDHSSDAVAHNEQDTEPWAIPGLSWWRQLRFNRAHGDELTKQFGRADGGSAAAAAAAAEGRKANARRARRDSSDDYQVSESYSSNTQALINLISNSTILYAPNYGEVLEVVRLANRTFEELALLQKVVLCLFEGNATEQALDAEPPFEALNLNFWRGFETEDELVEAGMGTERLESVFGGVVFQNISEDGTLPEHLTLTLRFHQFKVPPTDELAPSVTWHNEGDFYNQMYYYFGFVFLQDIVQRAVAAFHASESNTAEPLTFAQQFPVPAYRDDLFAWGIGRTLPLFMVLAWIYSVSMIVKNIVYEKERRLKEYMKMMGLSELVHWTGWFITSVVILTVSVLLLTFVLCVGMVLANSDPLIVFIYLESYAIATICLCFVFSTLFSKARIAAAMSGILYFGTYLPYIFVAIQEETLSATSKWAASILSTTAFGISASYVARYEESGEGLQWHNLAKPLGPCDNFTFFNALAMMWIDSLLYLLLTAYLEAIMPSYGLPQPWYFPFLKSYWFPNAPKYDTLPKQEHPLGTDTSKIEPLEDDEQDEAERRGIVISGLSKTYEPEFCSGGESRKALDSLSITLKHGQISSLLGHNGAGKTTTISLLTGLFPPTSGTAWIYGHDVTRNLSGVRQGLGICPQYNVLFDKLTVAEHLWFVARLRNIPKAEAAQRIVEMLQDIALSDKKETQSKALSGGMKRKLSVAMALLSGSQAVILDEPTAGMDPQARRSTWDLLLRYRGERTILLCTHHLDEADMLSDRINIIAHGRLRCAGSSLFLKQAYNASYQLTLILSKDGVDVKGIEHAMQAIVPSCKLSETVGREATFVLPANDVERFGPLFQFLEDQGPAFDIGSYGLSATTLEEVFLKVAEEAEREQGGDHLTQMADTSLVNPLGTSSSAQSSPSQSSTAFFNEVTDTDESAALTLNNSTVSASASPQGKYKGEKVGWFSRKGSAKLAKLSSDGSYSGPVLSGASLWWSRYKAVLLKRLHNVQRDRKAFFSQILLPAFFVCVGMAVATAFPPPEDMPALALDPSILKQQCAKDQSKVSDDMATSTAQMYEGSRTAESLFRRLSSGQSAQFSWLDVSQDEDLLGHNFTHYILQTYDELQHTRRIGATVEEAVNPSILLSNLIETGNLSSPIMRAWFDNRHFHSLPLAVSVINNAVLRQQSGRENLFMTVENHPFNSTADTKTQEYLESGTDLTVAINTILALSFVPASFVVFLISERVTKAKHLQMVSGLDIYSYWIGNFTWDIINYSLPALICLVIFLAFDLPAYSGRNLFPVAVLLVLYGWSITPVMYLASYLFKVPSTGYVTLICINLFVGLTATLATFILELFPDDPHLNEVGSVLRWVFLIFPNYCLGRGLMDLAANEYIAQFYEYTSNFSGTAVPYKDPFSFDLIGRNVMAMCLEGAIFFLLTLYVEHRRTIQKAASKRSEDKMKSIRRPDLEDSDVNAEAERVKQAANDEDVVVVKDLVKIYQPQTRKKRKVAVRGLSFGVHKGECFGLLGVNGAGKTSTFKMLTGDLAVTSGDAFVCGNSILRDMHQVRQHQGYCPQFDALNDLLTGRETLTMYSRLRGIPLEEAQHVVQWFLERMQLTRWADRPTCEYSGGNKRKLSVAIALLGTSSVVFLDEPSAGKDPRARRFLWNMISGVVRAGRSVILTSHAMDECQALCTRLAIMVNGTFRCLGSPQHLKLRYGRGYTLVAKLRTRNNTATIADLQSYIHKQLPGAVLEETHDCYVRYLVPMQEMPRLSVVFEAMEQARAQLGLEDYSVSQTSLEQIFCSFALEQDADDDLESVHDDLTEGYANTAASTAVAGMPLVGKKPKDARTNGASAYTFTNPAFFAADRDFDEAYDAGDAAAVEDGGYLQVGDEPFAQETDFMLSHSDV